MIESEITEKLISLHEEEYSIHLDKLNDSENTTFFFSKENIKANNMKITALNEKLLKTLNILNYSSKNIKASVTILDDKPLKQVPLFHTISTDDYKNIISIIYDYRLKNNITYSYNPSSSTDEGCVDKNRRESVDTFEEFVVTDYEKIVHLNNNFQTTARKKRQYLKEIITPKLLTLIKNEEFEFGYITNSEELVLEQIQEHEHLAREWIQEICLSYRKDKRIISAMLHIIAHIEYDLIKPAGTNIVLSTLVINKDNGIKELCVRALENWNNQECLEILKDIDTETQWLKEYINQVIYDLETRYAVLS